MFKVGQKVRIKTKNKLYRDKVIRNYFSESWWEQSTNPYGAIGTVKEVRNTNCDELGIDYSIILKGNFTRETWSERLLEPASDLDIE